MRALRATGSTLIVLGLTVLLFVVYELVGTSVVTKRHQSALANAFSEELVQPAVSPSPQPPSRRPGPRRPPIRPIARLRIPKIEVDWYVVEGVSLDRLRWGPGHYPESVDIGGRGVTAIAGHRTTYGAPFYRLNDLGAGDRIVIETTSVIYTYRVTGTKVIKPTDRWVLKGDPGSGAGSRLTLTTCNPRFSARQRLIVWADQIAAARRAKDAA